MTAQQSLVEKVEELREVHVAGVAIFCDGRACRNSPPWLVPIAELVLHGS